MRSQNRCHTRYGFNLPCRCSQRASTRGCVAHGSGAYQPYRSNQDGICPSWFGDDVDHRQDRAGNVSIKVHGHQFWDTYTTGMLAMFANASMSGTDVAPVLPGLAQMSRHVDGVVWCCC